MLFSPARLLFTALCLMVIVIWQSASAAPDQTFIHTVRNQAGFSLQNVRASIKRRYHNVQQLDIHQLRRWQTSGQPLLLLDVRPPAEYNVSHLKGARRVDPSIWHGPFMRRFGALAKGRYVVFYCSVGERSSKLAAYVQDALKKAGAKAVYNLDGGLFEWANHKLPMVDRKGLTRHVHPYNRYWGQLLKDRTAATTQPRS